MSNQIDWQAKFLAALKRSPNVSAAAKAAGIARQYVYEVRAGDPDFAKAWEDALGHAIDGAEGELYRRAVKGTRKPVYYQDRKIDELREYSDTLLIFLLKAHKPEKYRETVRSELTGANGGPIEHKNVTELTDDELANIAAGGSTRASKQAEGAQTSS